MEGTMIVENYSIKFKTKGRIDIIDLSPYLSDIMNKTKIRNGQMFIFALGSTSAITTMEYEPGLEQDIKLFFDKLIPYGPHYHHHETWGCDNGSSHLSGTLLKQNFNVPIDEGHLVLGTWQQVVYIEFDTRARNRDVHCQIMGI